MSRREVVEHELQGIYDELGHLRPTDVVERARENTHPLHAFFTWDDNEAAERYRLLQAQGLIRSVTIKFYVERGDEVQTAKVRRWVSEQRAGVEDPQGGYLPQEIVADDPQLREYALRTMRREIATLRRRYQDYVEFWTEIAELDAEGKKLSA